MSGRCVLIVDDERLVRWSLAQRLRADGLDVLEAETAADAVAQADKSPDVVILDYQLPDGDGLSILKRLHQTDPDLPVIMLTAHKDAETIVAAMKAGALDYVTKPFEVSDVATRVARALELTNSQRELRRIKEDLAKPFSFDSVVGDSAVMKKAKTLALKVAHSPSSTVLITGESGTGKDLLAKVIHYASSRAHRPFLNITCSALPETLLESELFGHERGAFTDARQQKRGLFEQADQGSAFLDEIGETTPTLQAKLLRFLEEKAFRRLAGTSDIKVDVRVIAATNLNLEERVREGRFREDLYYRLNVFRLEMPPLRDRGDDVVLLARRFVRNFAAEFRRPAQTLSPAAEKALVGYSWPGNVRELRNLVERAVILADGDTLEPGDFESLHSLNRDLQQSGSGEIQLPTGGLNLEDVERRLVTLALERTKGNQTKAAALLGLHRDQIRYRMEKFGLAKPENS
ncbi:MAG TPA: sigma-54 dependent transcriptional regulator [Vicinamibacterales bacterium]|nr:sigma-54 dependent transcriptional regulator [Vicinamibacterales bacterium]